MSAPPGPCVAPPDGGAARLQPHQIEHLIADAAGLDGCTRERLIAVWRAIVTAAHPDDRKIVADRLTIVARGTGLDRAVRYRDGDGFAHVISWALRGWDPWGLPR
jgi:hypothetical protein